jgi:histidyl-tRNA synthetase
MLLAATPPEQQSGLQVFVVTLAQEARLPAMRLAGALRDAGVACDLDYGGRGAKGQFRQADRSGAALTVVIGEDELRDGVVKLRDMSSGEESTTLMDAAAPEISRLLAR